jgi:hypothetical protein
MRYCHYYIGKAAIALVALLFVFAARPGYAEKSHYLYKCIKVVFDGQSETQESAYQYRLFNDVELKDFSREVIEVPRKGKIQDFSLKLSSPHFKPLTLSRKDGILISKSKSFELTSDRIAYSWLLGDFESGSEIQCFYILKNDEPDPYNFEPINSKIATDSLTIRIKYPSKKWRLRYSIDGTASKYVGECDDTTFMWKNIPPLEETAFKHAPLDACPGLRYSFESRGQEDDFSSWNDVYIWYAKRADSVSSLLKPEEMVKIADKPGDIVAAIARQCHYVAVELGDGGYVPDHPDNVWTKGYGDCKGLANLFVIWMRAAGYSAWPVMVFSNHSLLGNFDFPTPYTFNHEIAGYIDAAGDTAYQDLTAEYTPLGYLPIEEYGCFALPLLPGSTPLRLGYNPKEPDTIRFVIAGELEDSGSLKGKLDADILGQIALRWNWIEAQNRNVKDTQIIKEFLNDEIPKATLTFIKCDSLNSGNNYRFSAQLTIDKLALPKDISFVVKPWAFGLLSGYAKADTSVCWESFLTRNIVFKIEYRVRAGQGNYSRQDSDNWKYDFPGLQSHLANTSHGDSLITNFEMYLPPMTLSPEEYKLYINNCKQIQRSAQAGILFTH